MTKLLKHYFLLKKSLLLLSGFCTYFLCKMNIIKKNWQTFFDELLNVLLKLKIVFNIHAEVDHLF